MSNHHDDPENKRPTKPSRPSAFSQWARRVHGVTVTVTACLDDSGVLWVVKADDRDVVLGTYGDCARAIEHAGLYCRGLEERDGGAGGDRGEF